MGGAGLVFDNLGLNTVSILGRAPVPSILYLNRTRGEEVEVELEPVDVAAVWKQGRAGVYALLDHVHERFGGRYATDPRILATGPAALATDMGGIVSVPVVQGSLTPVDTWAGRGGMGTKLLAEHGIAAVIYGGTFVDEDFRDRKVADGWFEAKYQQKLLAKDLEATTKYRFDPAFNTGGTFGVNFAALGGRMMAFNYRTMDLGEQERLALHERLVANHYLRQFNEETIAPRHQRTCGEPCAAVCKKMRDEYKKDYEPYQTFGPLCGVFDQRAAERLVRHADVGGFDAISAGGVVAWMMEALADGLLSRDDLGVSREPRWRADGFDPVTDSAHNADLGVELLDSILQRRGIVDLSDGARKWGRSSLAHARRPPAGPVRLHRLRPSGMDGAEPVLDARGARTHADHGQVLPVLRSRLRAAPHARPHVRGALPARACHGQRGVLPVPPRLGGGARPGNLREPPRHEGAVRRVHGRHGEPDQLPQRLRVLGVRAEPRLRDDVPEARAGSRRQRCPRARRVDQTLREGQAGGRAGLVVRRAARESTRACGSSTATGSSLGRRSRDPLRGSLPRQGDAAPPG